MCAGADAEFAGEVGFDGLDGEERSVGYLAVAEPGRRQLRDRPFGLGQLLRRPDRLALARHQLAQRAPYADLAALILGRVCPDFG